MNKGLTLIEVIVVIVLIAILAALFVPSNGCGVRSAKMHGCTNNLKQLYALGHVYATTHKGSWPAETGEALWVALSKVQPPLMDEEEFRELFY